MTYTVWTSDDRGIERILLAGVTAVQADRLIRNFRQVSNHSAWREEE
jgi:hypothetical protein